MYKKKKIFAPVLAGGGKKFIDQHVQFSYQVTVTAGQATTPKFTFGAGAPPATIDWGDSGINEKIWNGDFETAGAGGADVFGPNWTENIDAGSLTNETSIVHSGGHAAKITSGASVVDRIYNTLIVGEASPSTIYELRMWTRGDGTNAGRYAIYDNIAASWIRSLITTSITGTTYTEFVYQFTAPANCTRFSIYLYGPAVNGGYAYFDDVSIKPITAEYVVSGQELYHPYVTAGTYTVKLIMQRQDLYLTGIDIGNDRAVGSSWLAPFMKLKALISFNMSQNNLTGTLNISQIPRRINTFLVYTNVALIINGDLSNLPRNILYFTVSGTNDPMSVITGNLSSIPAGMLSIAITAANAAITGNLSDLPASLQSIQCYNGKNSISGGSTPILAVALSSIYVGGNALSQSQVDSILLRLATDEATTTYATPTLSISGTNAAPSAAGLYNKAALVAAGWTVTTTIPTGLLAYFPMAEVSGTAITDISGNARHGVYGATLGYLINANSIIGVEQIVNPGFETPGAGSPDIFANWAEGVGTGGLIEDETTLVHSGSHAAKITQGSAGSAYVSENPGTNKLWIIPGSTLTLEFWTRGDGTNAGRYHIYCPNRAVDIVSIKTTGVTSTTYTKVTETFVMPAGCYTVVPIFYAGAANGNIAYYDDVSLKVTSIPISGPKNNLQAAYFSGAYVPNTFANIYTAGLAGAFNGAEGTVSSWFRIDLASIWSDAAVRNLSEFYVDADNYVGIYKQTTANLIWFGQKAGGTTKSVSVDLGATLNWVHIALTWSKSGNTLKAYVNGSQVGSTQTGLGTWVGSIASIATCIGAFNTSSNYPFDGALGQWKVWSRALSDAEIALEAA